MKLRPFVHSALIFAFAFGAFTNAFGLGGVLPTDLHCEYLKDPQGIDAPHPRLSWVLEQAKPSARGQRQAAYEVMVASSRDKLAADNGDVWDTGKVESDQSIQVAYAGKPLASAVECFWKVRVWDQDGKKSDWSAPAYWSVGLLAQADWSAKWVGWDEIHLAPALSGASWIWFPEGRPELSAPLATRYFRRSFQVPGGRSIKSAKWLVVGDNEFRAFINGESAGEGKGISTIHELDVRNKIHPGTNVVAVSVTNTGDQPNPAGLVALLKIEFTEGEPLEVGTDASWQSSTAEFAGWERPGFDESTWLSVRRLGPVGMAPWGDLSGPDDRRLPARWLRKEFKTEKKLRRAIVFFSGLGLSELYLNGERVGDEVLSPGLTGYTKRVFYVTHDVTSRIQRGVNTLGAVLGNGRFYAPRSGHNVRSFGYPKMRLQMRLEYSDGTVSLVTSDESWKLTTEGPILANNEYDGEDYDARKELPGWNRSGYDDSNWRVAQLVDAPGGQMASQMQEPIRVVQVLKPIGLSEPKPGEWVFDLGQNLVGWCRLQVSGPRGTRVTLRHAERLNPDGTLYVDNLRSAKATDTYILKGQGTEAFEPRFTYHGFRYVEVSGIPGKPKLEMLEGRVVHDDLPRAGSFICSNPILNRIYTNIFWGVRGNYRSMPTDCPQRDERQGWLGDRSEETAGETYLFDTAALHSKWLQDMADAQKENGSVPDVCPAYWPIYNDDVTWPSTSVILPHSLWRQYGDLHVVEEHYASAKKWMEHMNNFVADGIISKDSYGDWCVPPSDPKLIHSNDPAQRTDKALLATAYFYWDARLMAGYARVLHNKQDAHYFMELAEKLKTAFNQRFLDTDGGQYSNGTQTSCVLPLAFGMVPDQQRQPVFDHLVSKITHESNNHVGAGLIGCQWLMRVLSDNGRPDLAYILAAQTTYPSWAYMAAKGATTIWELWNGDTADPAMNSGNHVMLVGDLCLWLHEYLAGIRSDPNQPGFKHIIMKPEPFGDLLFVKASHRSPYGWIASEWHQEKGDFHWDILVPANTSATVYVPAQELQLVKENGRPASRAAGVRFLRMDNGRAVFEVGSGSYRFETGK